MQIYILNPSYEIIGLIDEYESVLWNKKYNDIGEAEIYLPCNDIYLALLEKGNYLYRYDDDMFCRIEKVQIQTNVESGDYLIATATDICSILSGRIVRWQTTYSGTVAGFISRLLNTNVIYPSQTHRTISNFTFDTSNFAEFTETIDITTDKEDLLQLIISTCKTYNYGFRLSFDIETSKLVFRLYKGRNKASASGTEYIEFSPTYANIISSNYQTDDSNYKNVVYVGYKSSNKDDDTIYVLSYPPNEQEISGDQRREVYVDATNTSREIDLTTLQTLFGNLTKESNTYYAVINGEKTAVATFEITTTDGVSTEKITVTDFTFLLLIKAVAASTLAERIKTQEFTGSVDTIDTYEYKADYDLGDTVKVINEYGISAAAQITEVLESDDNENGYEIEPKFEFIN